MKKRKGPRKRKHIGHRILHHVKKHKTVLAGLGAWLIPSPLK